MENNEFIVDFLDEVGALFKKMTELLKKKKLPYLEEPEAEEFSRILHNLKGASGSVGLKNYAAFIQEIESELLLFKEESAGKTAITKDCVFQFMDLMEKMGTQLLEDSSDLAIAEQMSAWSLRSMRVDGTA